MSFTYDITTSLGQVRFLIPDTTATAYDLEDAEITYILSKNGANVNAAAVAACKWLARKYSKMATFSADGLSVQNGQRAAEFATRARELEAQLLGGVSTVALNREDGYSEAAEQSEYQPVRRVIYQW